MSPRPNHDISVLPIKHLIVLWPVLTAGSGGDRRPNLLLSLPSLFFLVLQPKPSHVLLNFDLNQDCMQLCDLHPINPSVPFSHLCPPQVAQSPSIKAGTFQISAKDWSVRSIKDISHCLAKCHDMYCIPRTTIALSFYLLHLRSENITSPLPLLKLKATQQATLIV